MARLVMGGRDVQRRFVNIRGGHLAESPYSGPTGPPRALPRQARHRVLPSSSLRPPSPRAPRLTMAPRASTPPRPAPRRRRRAAAVRGSPRLPTSAVGGALGADAPPHLARETHGRGDMHGPVLLSARRGVGLARRGAGRGRGEVGARDAGARRAEEREGLDEGPRAVQSRVLRARRPRQRRSARVCVPAARGGRERGCSAGGEGHGRL
jgi:hypothetical protein